MLPTPAPRSPPAARSPGWQAIAIGQGSLGYLLAGLGPCLILLARDLAVPRSDLAWVSAGFGVGLLLLGLAGERLLAAAGAWRVLRGSITGLALGAVLLGASRSIHPAQAGALLLGVGGAGIVLVTPVIVSGAEAAKRLAVVLGLSQLTGIGAPLLISAVQAASGHGRAALLVPVPLLAWVAFRRRPAGMAAAPGAPASASAAGAASRAAWWWLAIVSAVSAEFAFVVWGAARLEDSGLGPAAASAAAAAFPAGMAAGRFLAPRVLDRLPVVSLGVALACTGTALAAAPVGPVLVATAIGLAGLGIAPLYPVLIDRLVREAGLDPRRAAAVGALASGTAVLFAPILLNALARAVTLRLGFLAAVPPLLVVLLLYLRGRASGRG